MHRAIVFIAVANIIAALYLATGQDAANIVEGCTDAETTPKPPWLGRKKAYIAHIRHASKAVRLVSCADKLHNARAIVADLRVMGDLLFDRFNGGKAGTLWYYQALAAAFADGGPEALAGELARTVKAMKSLARRGKHGDMDVSKNRGC